MLTSKIPIQHWCYARPYRNIPSHFTFLNYIIKILNIKHTAKCQIEKPLTWIVPNIFWFQLFLGNVSNQQFILTRELASSLKPTLNIQWKLTLIFTVQFLFANKSNHVKRLMNIFLWCARNIPSDDLLVSNAEGAYVIWANVAITEIWHAWATIFETKKLK